MASLASAVTSYLPKTSANAPPDIGSSGLTRRRATARRTAAGYAHRSHRTRRRQLDRKLVAIRKAIGGGGVEGAVSEGRVGMERHWSATTGSESEDA